MYRKKDLENKKRQMKRECEVSLYRKKDLENKKRQI